jgi:hypothetical protein
VESGRDRYNTDPAARGGRAIAGGRESLAIPERIAIAGGRESLALALAIPERIAIAGSRESFALAIPECNAAGQQ